jgi:hypothetical protein
MKWAEHVTSYGGEMHKRFSWENLDSGKETQVWRSLGKARVDVKA